MLGACSADEAYLAAARIASSVTGRHSTPGHYCETSSEPAEVEGELASEVGDDRRQWSESRGSRKEPRTCPHAVPTVRSGAADTEENSSADSGRHRLLSPPSLRYSGRRPCRPR